MLVIEAGHDPVKPKESRPKPASAKSFGSEAPVGEVTRVPGYYAAASEDAEMSWMFSVRHYEDTARQAQDDKYNKNIDPNTGGALPEKYLDPHPNGGKQGIFYPRASAVGGCTAHHAMITIRPNDKDWDYIAELTGDDSWRASAMRGYFAKLENSQYRDRLRRLPENLSVPSTEYGRWLVLLFDPRAVLDKGGHGFKRLGSDESHRPVSRLHDREERSPVHSGHHRAALGVLHGQLVARS